MLACQHQAESQSDRGDAPPGAPARRLVQDQGRQERGCRDRHVRGDQRAVRHEHGLGGQQGSARRRRPRAQHPPRGEAHERGEEQAEQHRHRTRGQQDPCASVLREEDIAEPEGFRLDGEAGIAAQVLRHAHVHPLQRCRRELLQQRGMFGIECVVGALQVAMPCKQVHGLVRGRPRTRGMRGQLQRVQGNACQRQQHWQAMGGRPNAASHPCLQSTHARALANSLCHGESSGQSAGAQLKLARRRVRSGCGIRMVARPSSLVSPAMPSGEPLGLAG